MYITREMTIGGLNVLLKESLTRLKTLKDIQLMSLAKSASVLAPSDKQLFDAMRSEARRRGRILDASRRPRSLEVHGKPIIPIAWQNSSCMVINKRQDMVVSLDGDLEGGFPGKSATSIDGAPEINQLMAGMFPDNPIQADGAFAHGILHRLDKDTTGALLAAKNYESFYDLRIQFAAGKVRKEYMCITEGSWGTLGHWQMCRSRIETSKVSNGKSLISRVVEKGGKSALTEYCPVANYQHRDDSGKKSSIVNVVLHTGRTHQIRVHMASLGHPLLFDPKYGKSDSSAKFFLHANSISFINTEGDSCKDIVKIEVPLPKRMERFVSDTLTLIEG